MGSKGDNTLSFRRAFLFSLHHASASVQLWLLRASSIRRMSMNKSMSTSSYALRLSATTNEDQACGTYLDVLLLSDMPSRLIPTTMEDPIHYPPV
jgi:hypothetical protein